MGLTKTENFTEWQNNTALLLKALAHPARLAIVEYLLKVKACVCGDIVSKLPLAQATISQHLKELKNAGIIQGSVKGTSMCYCLNPEAFELLSSYFSEALVELKLQDSSCC